MSANRAATGVAHDETVARARFHYPKVAFKRPISKVVAHTFEHERDLALDPDAATGFIVLDRREALGLPWPATLPTILARYLVLRADDTFSHQLGSNGETYYVLRGEGVSENGDDPVRWQSGDAFCLSGGSETRHRAIEHSVLLLSTNEPELSYARAEPSESSPTGIRPTLFKREDVERELAAAIADPADTAAGRAVILVTEAMQDRLVATPALSITFNTLEPGADQRPHRHCSAALTLCIEGEGVHSLIDGERIDWSAGVVMLTPSAAVHSHHNRGNLRMKSFVVQDSPLHAQMRTTNFQFV